MYLRRVNLNLLPIFLALLRTRSVSGAATGLGLSQPAVSDALARLRALFNDQLLVRIGGSMKLTPYADRLVSPLEDLCANLESFVRPEHFDPRLIKRELIVATSDFCGFLLARQILELLQEAAPGMSLHLIEVEHDLTDKMAARKIDFALLPQFATTDLAPAPLRFAALKSIETVVLMRLGHPLGLNKGAIEDAELAQYPHVVFQPDAVVPDTNRMFTSRSQFDFTVTARVGQMLLVPHLVIDSNSLAIVPRQLATAMTAVYPLESRDLVSAGTTTAIGLAWSPVFDGDRAHAWFREALIARLAPSN